MYKCIVFETTNLMFSIPHVNAGDTCPSPVWRQVEDACSSPVWREGDTALFLDTAVGAEDYSIPAFLSPTLLFSFFRRDLGMFLSQLIPCFNDLQSRFGVVTSGTAYNGAGSDIISHGTADLEVVISRTRRGTHEHRSQLFRIIVTKCLKSSTDLYGVWVWN